MQKQIATVKKNTMDEIRVELSEYKGFNLASIRVWTEHNDKDEMVPTKKGVSFKVSLLPEIREALEKAEAEAKAAGLLKCVITERGL